MAQVPWRDQVRLDTFLGMEMAHDENAWVGADFNCPQDG